MDLFRLVTPFDNLYESFVKRKSIDGLSFSNSEVGVDG